MRAKSRLLAVLVTAIAALGCVAPATAAADPVIIVPPGLCLGPRHVSIADHRGYEGTKAAGSTPTPFTFLITSTGCATASSVHFTTVIAGRARIGTDLTGASGLVVFAAGDMSTRSVTIAVWPDTVGEVTETFGVRLCGSTGPLAISRGAATGTILNDDPAPLQADPDYEPNFHCSE